MKTVKLQILCLSAILLMSCSSGLPSEIVIQEGVFSHVKTQESSGKKFDISTYNSGRKNLILVTPHEKTDLDKFSLLYTETFKAQGIKFRSEGNRHLGIGASNIVYLTTSPQLKSLSILIATREGHESISIEEASDIFQALNGLM